MLSSFDHFIIHNQHWESPKRFLLHDPQLQRLKTFPYQYQSPLIRKIPSMPGVYILVGGRQVGKSTFVKQLMCHWIEKEKIAPRNILYLTGELIFSAQQLQELLLMFLKDKTGTCFVVVDEINYIHDWDRVIKYMVDAGFLNRVSLLLTGSNNIVMQDAMKRFPGRRGQSDEVNFHYWPLGFRDYTLLLNKEIPDINALYTTFENYVCTGGYLSAINDLAMNKKITIATLRTYQEWVQGDFVNHGKSLNSLREVLTGIFRRYGSQVSWNSLSKELSIDHHKTIADYCELLQRMDVVAIVSALAEDKLNAAPKKAKKIYFSDPFIFHALNAFIHETSDPWVEQIKNAIHSAWYPTLIEGVVAQHCRRHHATYYIKGDKEIDVAYVRERKIHPIEVKWTEQLRPEEFKHLKSYREAIIAAKVKAKFLCQGIPVFPIPELLLELS